MASVEIQGPGCHPRSDSIRSLIWKVAVGSEIREMSAGDVSAIARLSEEGFSRSYQFDWELNAKALWDAFVSGRAYVAVAESDGKVVGYCNL